MLFRKYLLITMCFIFIITQFPIHQTEAANSDWLLLPEIVDVPVDKTFTVTFNNEVTLGDIDGMVIIHQGAFLPVTIKTKGRQAFITPVESLTADEDYEVRVFISNKKYKMNFRTIKPDPTKQLSYQGKVDVKSRTANNQVVKNINHYIARPTAGNPINIYVTDDYENRYGKGFAYEETADIVNSIIAERKTNPLLSADGLLDIFFYTNESNTVLDKNVQALIDWGQHSKYGPAVSSEMLMNGSTMPYDFRSSYVHEFVHFFDFHSFMFIENYNRPYVNYWGQNYNSWLIEGGAEYGGYFFYDYPRNNYNGLTKDFVRPNRESILSYAKQQGGNKKNLLYDVELNSFDDIHKSGSNNYGIHLALFWYLSETYGYQHIYDYAEYVGKTFKNIPTITQADKDSTAIKFFNKTEEEILKDWLIYFNYFDGKLQPFKETTTATATHIFQHNQPSVPESISKGLGFDENGTYKFLVNTADWIQEAGQEQSQSFKSTSTFQFELRASGHKPVKVTRNYLSQTGPTQSGDWIYGFGFDISPSEVSKLDKGTNYTLHPVNNHPIYKWIIPESIPFIW
ncbi:Ig-like domain-containing protein [Sporosarcina ureae]|uniref:Ig-like domain-containing protein n=1 Tax=Sporosarcina ureae TaxID=1571 RepID=UPI0026EA4783|nr:Ig-like domain-containing protein [Sporosarcina ureae]